MLRNSAQVRWFFQEQERQRREKEAAEAKAKKLEEERKQKVGSYFTRNSGGGDILK